MSKLLFLVLLLAVLATVVSAKGKRCTENMDCPLVDGVCCDSGTHCCPSGYMCTSDNPPRCLTRRGMKKALEKLEQDDKNAEEDSVEMGESSKKEHSESSKKEHSESSKKEHSESSKKEHSESSKKEHSESSKKEHSESSKKESSEQSKASGKGDDVPMEEVKGAKEDAKRGRLVAAAEKAHLEAEEAQEELEGPSAEDALKKIEKLEGKSEEEATENAKAIMGDFKINSPEAQDKEDSESSKEAPKEAAKKTSESSEESSEESSNEIKKTGKNARFQSKGPEIHRVVTVDVKGEGKLEEAVSKNGDKNDEACDVKCEKIKELERMIAAHPNPTSKEGKKALEFLQNKVAKLKEEDPEAAKTSEKDTTSEEVKETKETKETEKPEEQEQVSEEETEALPSNGKVTSENVGDSTPQGDQVDRQTHPVVTNTLNPTPSAENAKKGEVEMKPRFRDMIDNNSDSLDGGASLDPQFSTIDDDDSNTQNDKNTLESSSTIDSKSSVLKDTGDIDIDDPIDETPTLGA